MEDALYRFAAGQDAKDRELLESAFASAAVLDFSDPAARFGVRLAPFRGRSAIVEAVWGAIAELDTTHTITNMRILCYAEEGARVSALIEAQHLPRRDHSQNLLLKNMVTADMIRENGIWVLSRMDFRNLWKEGEPGVLFPPGR